MLLALVNVCLKIPIVPLVRLREKIPNVSQGRKHKFDVGVTLVHCIASASLCRRMRLPQCECDPNAKLIIAALETFEATRRTRGKGGNHNIGETCSLIAHFSPSTVSRRIGSNIMEMYLII